MFILNEGIMSKVTRECYFQSFSTIGTSWSWSKLLPSLKRATRTASELSESSQKQFTLESASSQGSQTGSFTITGRGLICLIYGCCTTMLTNV